MQDRGSPLQAPARRLRRGGAAGLEILLAVAAATGIVSLLKSTTSAAGLGIVYLLAVLTVAIRRGELPALITSLLSVLTLNFLFIPPLHRFAIAHSQDVVELAVLLIAAVVVSRLAALARARAAEAESKARVATAHEREAELLADAATAILAGQSLEDQLRGLGRRVADALGAPEVRIALGAVAAGPEERALELPCRTGPATLLVPADARAEPGLIERLAGPLGGLVDVAVERERVAARAAEAEATRRAEVAKTAILHAISHDLRSPLTAVRTAASALRTGEVSEEERLELIEAIDGEGLRLARLIDDLLDLSKIEAGAVAPQADWCDLRDVVATAARRLAPEQPLALALPAELPLVRADAAQLERVFANLLDNAVKASPPGAPVRVSAGVQDGEVRIRVIDDGPGVPAADQAHIFEPFVRGRGARGGGSGLGLAICRGFVEANGGRIELRSAPGRGASFEVTLPVAEHAPAGEREGRALRSVAG